MKKIILLLGVVIVSSQLIFADVALDKSLDEISFDKQAKRGSKVSFKVGIKKYIFTRPHKKNGKKALEVEYKNGKRDGEAKFYYLDGSLMAKGNYKDDKKDGFWEFYDVNGEIKEKVEFVNGVRK